LDVNGPLAKAYKEFYYLFSKATKKSTIGALSKSDIEEFGKANSGGV
jgi:hypothetical protein